MSKQTLLSYLGWAGCGSLLACVCWNLLHKSASASQSPQQLTASTAMLIGAHPDFLGDPASPYTLVEFADYQCPPCMAANAKIATMLKHFNGKLRFTFRNYPLDFHSQARPAALAAEAARCQGKFWAMHDALYQHQTTLSPSQIDMLADTLHLNRTRFEQDRKTTAPQSLTADKAVADQIGLKGTPTFILCCPDGRTLRVPILKQAEQIIK